MIKALTQYLEMAFQVEEDREAPGPNPVETAAAVLMVEISLADSKLTAEERRVIEDALRSQFGLPEEDARSILAAAEEEVDHSVSLYEYTRLINEQMTAGEKVQIVERLWEVAFADAVLDKYEEYYIRKIADLLYVPHVSLIKTRHRASRRR